MITQHPAIAIAVAVLKRCWPYILAVVIGAAIVLGLLALHQHGHEQGRTAANTAWQAKWAARDAADAKATADAQRKAREEEQRRQAEIEEVRKDAQAQIEQAVADAAAANDAADGMREQARRLAAAGHASCSSGTAQGSKAGQSPAVVLADVLTRIDQRAGELAQAYDRARLAGLSCERAYDLLTQEGRE